MKTEKPSFAALTDAQLIAVASNLCAATCAAMPKCDSREDAYKQADQVFEDCCRMLACRKKGEFVPLIPGADWS